MVSGVTYKGNSDQIAHRSGEQESTVLRHSNEINRHLIQVAEAGGGIAVFPLVPLEKIVRLAFGNRSSLTRPLSLLAHGPVQLEFVPPQIEVGLFGRNELWVKHIGAQVLYPNGLASYDREGHFKMGTRYIAAFPDKNAPPDKDIFNGTCIVYVCERNEVTDELMHKMTVYTMMKDVVVSAVYFCPQDKHGQLSEDFLLVSATILNPAQKIITNRAPLARRYVAEDGLRNHENMQTEDSMREVLLGNHASVLEASIDKDTGNYTFEPLDAAFVEHVFSHDPSRIRVIVDGPLGKRQVNIPKLIPTYGAGLGLCDLESTLMVDPSVLEEILADCYANGLWQTQAIITKVQ